MKIGALQLFSKLNGKGYNIAAWHRRNSITWRWLLHYIPGCYWPRLFAHRNNTGIYFDLFTPLGRFNFQTQQSIPWPKRHYRPEYDTRHDDTVDAFAYTMQGIKSNESKVDKTPTPLDGVKDNQMEGNN